LNGSLPVCRELLASRQWLDLQQSFFREVRPGNPLLWQIPGEFVAYMAENRNRHHLPPWMPELGHYEWIELAVYHCDVPLPNCCTDRDLLATCPVLNPTARILAYTWPVHRIAQGDEPPTDPQPSLVVVWRNIDEQVRIEQLPPVTARLLELIESGSCTGQAACAQLKAELPQVEPLQLSAFVSDELQRLRQASVIVGSRW
jgi:hypothetical protein